MNIQRTTPRHSAWDWRAALVAGELASDSGDELRAEARFREAVHLAEQEASAVGLVESLNSLGVALARRDKLAEAEDLLRQAAASAERSDVDARVVGKAIGNLAEVVSRLGKFDEALALFRKVLNLVDPDVDPVARASAHNNLGMLLVQRGRSKEAVDQLRTALSDLDRVRNPVEWAMTQSNLATVLLAEGREEEAAPVLRESLATLRDALGDMDAHTIQALAGLGDLLRRTGQVEEGSSLLREALTRSEKSLGANHPITRRLRVQV